MLGEVAHILAARKQRKDREGPQQPFKASNPIPSHQIPSPPNSTMSRRPCLWGHYPKHSTPLCYRGTSSDHMCPEKKVVKLR